MTATERIEVSQADITRLAVDALQELGMHREVQLVISGGIRTVADVAKALALGACRLNRPSRCRAKC